MSPFLDTFYYSFLLKISAAGKLVYGTELRTGSSSCFGGSACIGKQSTSADVSALFVNDDGTATVAGPLGGA